MLIYVADVKLSNIMLEFQDTSTFAHFEQSENDQPAPCKVIDNKRSIYATRPLRWPQGKYNMKSLFLCDLGEARLGTTFPWVPAQPYAYKAPESMLELELGSGIDIWALACMVRHMNVH